MGIVGPDEMHLVALHPLEAHPDVSLDVLHQVAEVDRPVGVGESGGYEEAPPVHCYDRILMPEIVTNMKG
jgi:hypothetical protein